MSKTSPTRAIIHLDALLSNLEFVRAAAPKQRILVPVKADAYGHGAVEVSKTVLACPYVTHLGVARVSEGRALRDAGIDAPVLLFSIAGHAEIDAAVQAGLTLCVGSSDYAAAIAEAASNAGKDAGIFLKIDTGMGRLGCWPEETLDLAKSVKKHARLRLDGCLTHLAVSDSEKDDDVRFTKEQVAAFESSIDSLKSAGIDPGIVSAAASGGILTVPSSLFDMVRPGILCYGYAPSTDTAKYAAGLKPVMELVTEVSFVKRVEKGKSVSYGRKWTAPQSTWVATLPVGYGDGLPRSASGKIKVLIEGRLYPQVGRICMDQCMVDLGETTSLKTGTPAVIFGGGSAEGNGTATDAESFPGADTIAAACSTIPYEILTGISKRVPRVYVNGVPLRRLTAVNS
jgi:alanine racemase